MALQSLQDYLRVLNSTQSSKVDHTFKVFQVCPKLNDIISKNSYISTTSIHISGGISDFSLKGNVQKNNTEKLEFFLESSSFVRHSDVRLKWSVSIYNNVTDIFLEIGESFLSITYRLRSTSDKLSVGVEKLNSFLQNNQLIVSWNIEFITSMECNPDSSNALKDCASAGDIAQETDVSSMVNTLFLDISNKKSKGNQGKHKKSFEDISKTIDQCRQQALLNKTDIGLIQLNVSELEKRINDLWDDDDPMDDIHVTCCVQCTDTSPLRSTTLSKEHHTDLQSVSGTPSKLNDKSETSSMQNKDLEKIYVFPMDLSSARKSVFGRSGPDIDLLIIGKSGSGKSSLGNSLLQCKAFGNKPLTEDVTCEVTEYCGRNIKVVDSPAVGDTDCADGGTGQPVADALAKAISVNPRGYHAVLIAVKFDVCFTQEDLGIVDSLKEMFGESFVKKFCIIVMTGGDQFEEKVNVSFQEWLKAQTGVLVELVKECNNRVILFDNKTTVEEKRQKQLHSLLQELDYLLFENCRYTNEQFELASHERETLSSGYQKIIVTEELMNEANIILQLFIRTHENVEPITDTGTLEELLDRANRLYNKVEGIVNNSGAVSEFSLHVQTIRNYISDEMKLCHQLLEYKEHSNQEQGEKLKRKKEDKSDTGRVIAECCQLEPVSQTTENCKELEHKSQFYAEFQNIAKKTRQLEEQYQALRSNERDILLHAQRNDSATFHSQEKTPTKVIYIQRAGPNRKLQQSPQSSSLPTLTTTPPTTPNLPLLSQSLELITKDESETRCRSSSSDMSISQQYETLSQVNSGYEYADGFQHDYSQTIPLFGQEIKYDKLYYDRQRYMYEIPHFELDLLLIGKTGQGSSALGNSILRRQAFESKYSCTTVTTTVTDELAEYNGMVIKVVDCPGVGNTNLSDDEAKNKIVESLSGSITVNPIGFHAFLLVFKFGDRFTKESRLAVEALKRVFGENFVKKFCILVMTFGDMYKGKQSFRDWVDEQRGDLAALIRECDHRVILYDNKTQETRKKEGQLRALIDMVLMLALKNGRYTDEQFNLAKLSRDALMLETRKLAIEEEAIKEASLILDKLQSLQADTDDINSPKKSTTLQQLAYRSMTLLEKLKEHDKDTGVLKEIIYHVRTLQNSINDETRLVNRISLMMKNVNQGCQIAVAELIRRQIKEFNLNGAEYKSCVKIRDPVTDQHLPELSDEDSAAIQKLRLQWTKSVDLGAELNKIKMRKKNFILKAIQGKVFAALKSTMAEHRSKS